MLCHVKEYRYIIVNKRRHGRSGKRATQLPQSAGWPKPEGTRPNKLDQSCVSTTKPSSHQTRRESRCADCACMAPHHASSRSACMQTPRHPLSAQCCYQTVLADTSVRNANMCNACCPCTTHARQHANLQTKSWLLRKCCCYKGVIKASTVQVLLHPCNSPTAAQPLLRPSYATLGSIICWCLAAAACGCFGC